MVFENRSLCQVQTVNLCKGETTNERLGKNSYQRQHEVFRETFELDFSVDDAVQGYR